MENRHTRLHVTFDERSVRQIEMLLSEMAPLKDVGERVTFAARTFLNTPYGANPLGSNPDVPEPEILSLCTFDCMTLVETLLSLGMAADYFDFSQKLRLIRYREGVIDYMHRRHYFSQWIDDQVQMGRIIFPTDLPAHITRTRSLSRLTALGTVRESVSFIPKRQWTSICPKTHSGDIVGFVSTRADLDYFHVGLLIRIANDTQLLHASRSARVVCVEPMEGFLFRNRMTGLTILRPQQNTPLTNA